MTLLPDPGAVLHLVLPKLLRMTVVSAVAGAVLGLVAAGHPGWRLRRRRPLLALTLAAYAISALVLTVTLSPPAVAIRTLPSRGPVAPLAEVRGLAPLPSHLALSGDGRQLAVLSVRDGRQQVDLIDLPSGNHHRLRHLRGTPEGQQTLRDILSFLAFTPDGRELVTAAPQQVQLRPLPAGRPRQRLEGGQVAYPMADQRLVTLPPSNPRAANPAPRSLQVWDLARGRRLQTLPADLNPLDRPTLPVAVSPDGRLLAFPRRVFDDRIELWEIPQSRRIATLELGPPAGLLALAFSPEGRQLAVALGQGPPITLWDLATRRRLRSLDTPDRPQQLHWTSEGLLVGGDAGLRLLRPQDGRVLHTLAPASAGPTALSGDRSTFAAPLPGRGIVVWRVGRPPLPE